jgi:hypothetical protein
MPIPASSSFTLTARVSFSRDAPVVFGAAPDADGPVDRRGAEFNEVDLVVAFGGETFHRINGGLEDLAGAVDVGRILDTDGDVASTQAVVRDVLDDGAEDRAVGQDEASIVGRVHRGREEFDLVDLADRSTHVDDITDLERPEDEQHDAGREVAECALECKADGETGSTDDGGESGDAEAEVAEASEHREDEHGPLDRLGDELREGEVHLGLAERLAGEAGRPAGDDPGDEDEDEDADHLDGVINDRVAVVLEEVLKPGDGLVGTRGHGQFGSAVGPFGGRGVLGK